MSPTAPHSAHSASLGSRDPYMNDYSDMQPDSMAPPRKNYTPRGTSGASPHHPHDQYDQGGDMGGHLEPHRLVCRTPPSPSDMYSGYHPSHSPHYGGYSPHGQRMD